MDIKLPPINPLPKEQRHQLFMSKVKSLVLDIERFSHLEGFYSNKWADSSERHSRARKAEIKAKYYKESGEWFSLYEEARLNKEKASNKVIELISQLSEDNETFPKI